MLCWCSLSSCAVGPLWSLTTFFCLLGMRANLGVMAAVLTVMSVLSFSFMSLLCLWCKRKSSKCIYQRLDHTDCGSYFCTLRELMRPVFHIMSSCNIRVRSVFSASSGLIIICNITHLHSIRSKFMSSLRIKGLLSKNSFNHSKKV